jgi:hypothetical protein
MRVMELHPAPSDKVERVVDGTGWLDRVMEMSHPRCLRFRPSIGIWDEKPHHNDPDWGGFPSPLRISQPSLP